MSIKGKLRRVIEEAGDPAHSLFAAGRLLHERAFDPVPLDELHITPPIYEARWSDSCPHCGRIWIGTKAGEVVCMDLARQAQGAWRHRFDSGVRALVHLHDDSALAPGATLLVGTDDGFLHRLGEHRDAPPLHLDTWWRVRGGARISVEEGVPRASDERYTIGLTAISVLRHRPDQIECLIATRSGALFVLKAASGFLELRKLHQTSDWIQWILGDLGDKELVCISRGGDVIRIDRDEPERQISMKSLPLLVTAAMRYAADDGGEGILIGMADGLIFWKDDIALSIPVTSAPVLCLDMVQISSRRYVILGLGDGTLRVMNSEVISALIGGRPVDWLTSPQEAHRIRLREVRSFATSLGSAVLAAKALNLSTESVQRCFLLVALRDHGTRVFHLDARERTRSDIARSWSAFAAGRSDRESWDAFIAAAARSREPEVMFGAHTLLLDSILPRLDTREEGALEWVRDRVLGLIPHTSSHVLRTISRGIGALAGTSMDVLMEMSVALLRAMRLRSRSLWRPFVAQHLKALHHAAHSFQAPEETARIIAWTRFVRKYLLMGETFTGKEFKLRDLIDSNQRTRKFLDAMIYQSLLYQRRYDLEWRASVGEEIHSVHLTLGMVMVATRSGRLVFFSGAGRRILPRSTTAPDGGECDWYREGNRILALASVGSDDDRATFALSLVNAMDTSRSTLLVVTLKYDPDFERLRISSQTVDHAPDEGPVIVHSMRAVPGEPNTLIAGLDSTRHDFGVLSRSERAWTMRMVRHKGKAPALGGELPGVTPGRARSRALDVICIDATRRRYLAAIGSDDGLVRLYWLDRRFNEESLIRRSVSVRHPIEAIRLTRDPRDEACVACVGTASGDLFMGSIGDDPNASVEPILREWYYGSVRTLCLWKPALFGCDTVLVTATDRGRVCIHHIDPWRGDGALRVSELNNYYFRGIRLDQFTFRAPIVDLATIDGTDDFVVACNGGALFKGSVCYARDSIQRKPMWERFEELLKQEEHHRLLFPHDAPGEAQETRRLDLLDLVDLDSGSLRRYLLRKRLMRKGSWGDAASIEHTAERHLQGLVADVRAERELIKIVIKSLSRTFLDKSPTDLLYELRTKSPEEIERTLADEAPSVRAAVEILERQIVEAPLHAAAYAGRARIAAFKELFRVHVLRHASRERFDSRPIQDALVAALSSCLRDDDRVVRIEALRAVGITLRNLGVMRRELAGSIDLAKHLFPRGVEEIFWLLDPLTEGLKRYPDVSVSAILSTAWDYVASLAPIFRLFPESTLALCDRITRANAPMGALEVLVQRLRSGRGGQAIARRISHLYLVPCLGMDDRGNVGNNARDAYIDNYRGELDHGAIALADSDATDKALADRLTRVYNRLARFWEIKSERDLRRAGEGEVMIGDPGPIRLAEQLCGELARLATMLARKGRTRKRRKDTRRAAIDQIRKKLSSSAYASLMLPFRHIAHQILDHWWNLYDRRAPDVGDDFQGYRLTEELGEGGYGRVFLAEHDGQKFALKFFKHRAALDNKHRHAFKDGVETNKRLSKGQPGIVRVYQFLQDSVYPACVMEWCNAGDLSDFLKGKAKVGGLSVEARVAYALSAAKDLGAALRAAHSQQVVHRDIHERNILVHQDLRLGVRFKLGDFDFARSEKDMRSWTGWVLHLPSALRRPELLEPQSWYWDDAAALALVLCSILTGESIRHVDSPDDVTQLANKLADLPRTRASASLSDALIRMLCEPGSYDSAGDFLDTVAGVLVTKKKILHRRLSFAEAQDLCECLIQLGADWSELEAGLPASIKAGIPDGDARGPRLSKAIHHLNDADWILSEHPLALVLQNATRTFAGRQEEAVLRRHLEALRGRR